MMFRLILLKVVKFFLYFFLNFIKIGSTIDFKEDMMSSSFRIDRNPNAQQTCSCGSSFSKKEEE